MAARTGQQVLERLRSQPPAMWVDFMAAADHPVSVEATSSALGLHRSIVYRLLRTLEGRRLIERNADGDFSAGPYLAVLSRSVRRSLRAAAAPVLADLAEDLQMTAFLVVADGDEAVTIDSVEPTSMTAHVAYRPGTRHPIDRGAPGLCAARWTRTHARRACRSRSCPRAGVGAGARPKSSPAWPRSPYRSPTRVPSPSCGSPETR